MKNKNSNENLDCLNPESTPETGEQRIMGALLSHLYIEKENQQQEDNLRINKVLSAIDSHEEAHSDNSAKPPLDHKPTNVVRMAAWKQSWMSIAVSVTFVMFTLTFVMLPNKSAFAEVNSLMAALADMGDRLYQISIISESQHKGKSDQNNNIEDPQSSQLADKKHLNKSAAKWLNGAQLYMRGNDQFLLMSKSKKGYKYRGQNTIASWRGNHDKLVEYSEDKKRKLPLANNSSQFAFLSIEQLLVTLKNDYDLTLIDNIPYENNSITNNLINEASSYSQLSAVRKSTDVKGVKEINIIYRSDNYQIDQITYKRAHLQGNRTLVDIHLTLLSTDALAPDFFEPKHHLKKLDFLEVMKSR